MLVDGITNISDAPFNNLLLASGTLFPDGSPGELFYRTDENAVYVFTGVEWIKVNVAAPTAGDAIYDVAVSVAGPVTASTAILNFITPRAFSIPVTFAGSYASAGTPPTAPAEFSLRKNGAQFGTLTISATNVATFFTSNPSNVFAVGDVLSIVSPATDLPSDLAITIKTTLS